MQQIEELEVEFAFKSPWLIEGLAPLPVQAQKEKQQAGGPGKGGAKKSDGGVRFHPSRNSYIDENPGTQFHHIKSQTPVLVSYCRQSTPPSPFPLTVYVFPMLLVWRWNSWTTFLVEDSGHKLESSQTRIIVWSSTLPSFFRSIYEKTRVSFLADFL